MFGTHVLVRFLTVLHVSYVRGLRHFRPNRTVSNIIHELDFAETTINLGPKIRKLRSQDKPEPVEHSGEHIPRAVLTAPSTGTYGATEFARGRKAQEKRLLKMF